MMKFTQQYIALSIKLTSKKETRNLNVVFAAVNIKHFHVWLTGRGGKKTRHIPLCASTH